MNRVIIPFGIAFASLMAFAMYLQLQIHHVL